MNNKNELLRYSQEQQFAEVVDIIVQHRSKALRVVNEELLLTAWHVGRYVSAKLKNEEWGSKVVTQLSEYIRSQHPEILGICPVSGWTICAVSGCIITSISCEE